MKDENKTKEQLLSELVEMRHRIVELEASQTERKGAEEVLRVKDSAIASSINAVAIADVEGNLTYVNASFLRLWGYDDEKEVLGRPAVEFWQLEQKAAAVVEVLRDRGSWVGELVAKRKDGSLSDVQLLASMVTDAAGNPICMKGLFMDITECKRVGEALWKSEEKYRSLVDNIELGIFRSTPGPFGKFLEVNLAMEEITGYPREELLRMNVSDLYVHPEEREAVLEEVATGVRKKTRELNLRRKDGSEIVVSDAKVAVRDDTGKVIYFDGIIEDITERKRAEEQLRKSRDYLEKLTNSMWDAVFSVKMPERVIEWANDSFGIIGYEPEECVGRTTEFLYPDKSGFLDFGNKLKKTMASGKDILHTEQLLKRKNGDTFPTEIITTLFREKGEVVRVTSIVRDITKRKQAEEALRQSEEKVRRIFDSVTDGIAVTDLNGVIVELNERALEICGVDSKDAVLGKTAFELIPQRDGERAMVNMQKALEKGAIEGIEYSLLRPDGSEYPGELSASVLRDASGNPVGFVAIVRDITERKLAEKALKASEEQYRVLVENASEAIVVAQDGMLRLVNPKAMEVTGYSTEELTSKPFPEFIHPDDRDMVVDRHLRRLKGQEFPYVYAFRIVDKGGDTKWVEINAVLIEWEGRPATLDFLSDITQRKQAQDALQESERKSKAMLESIGDHMSMMDKDLNIVWANDVAKRIFGDDIVSKKCYAAYHGRTKPCEPYPCLTLQAFQDGKIHQHETQVIGKNGEIIDFHCIANVALWDGDGKPAEVIEISRDITGRRQAEEEIRKLSQYLRSVINNANVVLHVIDRQGNVLLWNKAAEVISGYSREEVVGHNKVWKWLYPDKEYRRAIAARTAAVIDGEILEDFQSTVRTKAGEDRTLSFYSTSLVGEDGNSNGSLWLGTDITGRKRAEAEKRELEQRAQLASRLTTVGEMASGIAHEINNPLTSVIGFAQLLMRKDIPEDIKEDAKIMNDSAQRVANIVKRLLAFARQRKPERVYADINDIIETTLAMRAYAMETGNIKVVTQLDPQLPRTMADASQLQQVFLNIIVNAETEMKLAHGSGKFVVGTGTVDNTIRISFRDDGPGIAKENLGRIFDPFFTTREVGEGTGLGLSICHAIVAEHNGQLCVKSKLGKGATFIVELPVIAEEKQLGLPEAAPDDSIKIGRAKILVVDDDPGTLELLSQVLTAEGHEVQTAATATDALERIESERYSLILLDIKLPGMSGIELYRSIQKIAESLARRILFITGDVMGVDTKDFLSKTKAPYISKPFDIEQLREDIRRILIPHRG